MTFKSPQQRAVERKHFKLIMFDDVVVSIKEGGKGGE